MASFIVGQPVKDRERLTEMRDSHSQKHGDGPVVLPSRALYPLLHSG